MIPTCISPLILIPTIIWTLLGPTLLYEYEETREETQLAIMGISPHDWWWLCKAKEVLLAAYSLHEPKDGLWYYYYVEEVDTELHVPQPGDTSVPIAQLSPFESTKRSWEWRNV